MAQDITDITALLIMHHVRIIGTVPVIMLRDIGIVFRQDHTGIIHYIIRQHIGRMHHIIILEDILVEDMDITLEALEGVVEIFSLHSLNKHGPMDHVFLFNGGKIEV